MICALLHAAGERFEAVGANTLEEIALAVINSAAPRLVIGARQPTDELRNALIRAGSRFVMALDDPHAAYGNLLTRHRYDWKEAVRAVAGSCAAVMSYAAMPGALVLRADREGKDPLATVTAIARWLDLAVASADIAALVEEHAEPGGAAAQDRDHDWREAISAADRAVVDGALSGYVDYFRGAGLGQMLWARDLFFVGDAPELAATETIDVAGPVRNLLFGPYLTLPPGEWAATVVLAVSKLAADISYSVEILSGAACLCLGRGTIQPRGEGVCEATIEFTVAEATEQPIALRVANLRFAFGGRLALAHVAVSPRVKPRPYIPAELTAALGL